MHTKPLPVVNVPAYQSVAYVTITLLSNEYDGKTMIDVNHGHLNRDEVIAIALQALTNDIVEMFLPTPFRK